MRVFFDCEFLEGKQNPYFLGLRMPWKTKPTIDLISIGLAAGNSMRHFICREFNVDEAWHRCQLESGSKVYWLRYNVLLPLLWRLVANHNEGTHLEEVYWDGEVHNLKKEFFKHNNNEKGLRMLKKLLAMYGMTRKEIAAKVKEYCGDEPELWAYYADYDWVALCQSFGAMMDLPKGWPFFCRDLIQLMHEISKEYGMHIDLIKSMPGYPTQENEHMADDDANWNLNLYDFLQNLKQRLDSKRSASQGSNYAISVHSFRDHGVYICTDYVLPGVGHAERMEVVSSLASYYTVGDSDQGMPIDGKSWLTVNYRTKEVKVKFLPTNGTDS